jgi:hypothetical protein
MLNLSWPHLHDAIGLRGVPPSSGINHEISCATPREGDNQFASPPSQGERPTTSLSRSNHLTVHGKGLNDELEACPNHIQ